MDTSNIAPEKIIDILESMNINWLVEPVTTGEAFISIIGEMAEQIRFLENRIAALENDE